MGHDLDRERHWYKETRFALPLLAMQNRNTLVIAREKADIKPIDGTQPSRQEASNRQFTVGSAVPVPSLPVFLSSGQEGGHHFLIIVQMRKEQDYPSAMRDILLEYTQHYDHPLFSVDNRMLTDGSIGYAHKVLTQEANRTYDQVVVRTEQSVMFCTYIQIEPVLRMLDTFGVCEIEDAERLPYEERIARNRIARDYGRGI